MKYYLFALIICCVFSCKKKDSDPVVSPYTSYTFTNKLDKSIIIRVIDSLTGNNITLNATAKSRVSIPAAYLADEQRYKGFIYYWATADYTVSNWYLNWAERAHSAYAFVYDPVRTIYNVDIDPVSARNDMRYCLTGMDQEVTWKAVDAYDNAGNSIWSTLGNNQRTHEIKTDYLYRATYFHANIFGAPAKEGLLYTLVDSTDKFVWKNTFYSGLDSAIIPGYIRMTNDVRPYAPLHTVSTDSLYMSLGGTACYYLMIKNM